MITSRPYVVNKMAENLAAARHLRDRDRDPNEVDMFAAGIADGISSCASWLGILDDVERAARNIEMEEAA